MTGVFCGCSSASNSSKGNSPPATDDSTSQEVADARPAQPAPSPSVPGSPDGGVTATSAPDAAAPLKPDAAAQAAVDAAAADVAPTAPSPDAFFGASRCQSANVLFCEDFESGTLDPTKWTLTQTEASVGVDSTKVARGQKGFHVKIVNPTSEVYHLGAITTVKTFPVAGQRLFVRAFVQLPAVSTHRHYGVFLAAGNTRYHVDVIPEWNAPYLPANFRLLWDKGPGGEPPATYGKPWTQTPLGRWACWEWELRGTNNEVHFSIDDVDIPGLKVDASMNWTAPTTARLRFGIESFHAMDAGFNLWIDEIAVSAEKIGCVR